jgi:LysM repeat protein
VFNHTVRRGDTLSSISEKYGVPISTLRKLNGMGRSSSLAAGKKLRIR